MMRFDQTGTPADPASSFDAAGRKLRALLAGFVGRLRISLTRGVTCGLVCGLALALHAQELTPTGPQQLAFAGLRAILNNGQINAIVIGAQGSLYLLIDQKDGVRLLRTDAAATNVLAQSQIGAKGDIGLA